MKHDPTLPIAEGWDPDNDCSRDSTETAEDGKPYRAPKVCIRFWQRREEYYGSLRPQGTL